MLGDDRGIVTQPRRRVPTLRKLRANSPEIDVRELESERALQLFGEQIATATLVPAAATRDGRPISCPRRCL
jgi:hypothetical protein